MPDRAERVFLPTHLRIDLRRPFLLPSELLIPLCQIFVALGELRVLLSGLCNLTALLGAWRAAREIESGMAPEFTLASGGLQQALREQRCPHPET
jgi:hypothetical protein